MKDFTALIDPVVKEILIDYEPVNYSKFGFKQRLIEREPMGDREWCESISLYDFNGQPELPFSPVVYNTVSGRLLLKELHEYTKVAETYDGELDMWEDQEQKRIARAIAVALINKAVPA